MTGLDGRRRIGQGAEAEIYDWDDRHVLRLMRSPAAGPSLAMATVASEAARASGVRTPRVLELVEVDGRPGQIMERVDGPDLFAVIEAKPQRLLATARDLARIQSELHRVEAPAELEPMHDRLARRLTESDSLPGDLRDRALAALDGLPGGGTVCHGDFHPGNILLTEQGPVLIDWSSATSGDPTADFARTRLLIEAAALPPETPTALRLLATAGRKFLLRRYARTYRALRPVDRELADRWRAVYAAVRLTEIETSTTEGRAVRRIAEGQLPD